VNKQIHTMMRAKDIRENNEAGKKEEGERR
jgi:hypothetical protein